MDALPAIKIDYEGIDSFEKVLHALEGFYCKVSTVSGHEHEGLMDGLDYHGADDDGSYLVLVKADKNGQATSDYVEIPLDDATSIYFY